MEYLKKLGYIKGLAEGLQLDDGSKENRVLSAVIELLDDLVHVVSELEQVFDASERDLRALDAEMENLQEQVENIGRDVQDVSEFLDEIVEKASEASGDEGDGKGSSETLYEVRCPACGEEIVLDEDMLDRGGVTCPACNEPLEFDFECNCGQHTH